MKAARALLHALDPVVWARDALGFEAEPWQEGVLRSAASRVALNCSRQAGKSTLAAVLALHRAVHRPGALVLLAAPSLRQSGELFRKASALHLRLSPQPTLIEDSATTIALSSGSRIVCVPGSEATSRGFSAPDLIVLDEASRIDDDSIAAFRPMLANGRGRLLMLSTPAGQRGSFFEACTQHASDWSIHTVPATDIPRISRAFLETERRAIGPRAFAQEYMCEFCETDAALFDHATVAACLDPDVAPLFGPGGAATLGMQMAGMLSNTMPLGLA